MNNQDFIELPSDDGINIKEILLKYLRFWPLYLAGVIVALAIAKIQLRYSQNIYNSYATIKVLAEENGGDIDLSGLPVNGSFFKKEVNMDNEIEILHSKRLLQKVVEDLDMTTTYYSKGQVRTSELWGDNIPFRIEWIVEDSSKKLLSSPEFNVVFSTKNSYNISLESGFTANDIKVGDWFSFKGFKFKLSKVVGSDYAQKAENQTPFSFKYKSALLSASQLSKQLLVSHLGAGSDILMLSINGPIREKNEAILNTIIRVFDEDGQRDRQQVAERTEEFVNDRLNFLVEELDSIENSLVDYKKTTDMVSIEIDADKYTGRDEEAYKQEIEIGTQILLAKNLRDNLIERDSLDYIPADIGLSDPSVNGLISKHNEMISQRLRALETVTYQHPSIAVMSRELEDSREIIIGSIQNLIKVLNTQLKTITSLKAGSSGRLSTLPYKEKVLRNINRQQAIKENLYLFLLEKRETASLTKAVTAPSLKIVDYAFSNNAPVAPNRRSKYIISFFIGLILPLAFVYLRFLLDTKIHSKEDLNRVLGSANIPIIGEVPMIPKDEPNIITKNDRSELAEAFRVIRTNLSYMNSKGHELGARKIIVTSSTKSEGKTFTSYNTAITMASSNKKVLLIGADLRNPQLHTALGMDKNTAGLTTYLHDDSTDLKDLITEGAFGFEDLDIMLSGYIPPNPAELLLNGRFEDLLKEVDPLYDYIIIDSAPTLLVTDTFLIAEYADVCMYLTRAGVTDNKVLDHVMTIKRSNKLPSLGVILNGIGMSGSYGYGYKYQYNYGYGYSYSEDKKKRKKWWEVWK